ncbi:uncharacterized protein LOC142750459 [Rhinoderma darwinii]|uniref:uncharacterized protein LOC142750459 n=1 Tax=Rhinoderma darwinii TaxID=43563 RepID=UPI003F661B80
MPGVSGTRLLPKPELWQAPLPAPSRTSATHRRGALLIGQGTDKEKRSGHRHRPEVFAASSASSPDTNINLSGLGPPHEKLQSTHKSGAQKRRVQQFREQQQKEEIAKIPKLDTFFKKKTQPGTDQEPSSSLPSTSASDPTNVSTESGSVNAELDIQADDPVESIEELGAHVEIVQFPSDVGLWGENISKEVLEYWVSRGSKVCQNVDADFKNSGVFSSEGYYRYCNKSYFTHVNPKTKEISKRNWLCYSPTNGKLFCFACKLIASKRGPFTHGFNDWKHAEDRIFNHECSDIHKQSVLLIVARGQISGRIDSQIISQLEGETLYWRKVLKRCLIVIQYLAERGLPLRGKDEIIGSPHNGNYLGILETMANVDEFLDEHIKQYANKGKGHTSYLSSTICEELIQILGFKILSIIGQELKKAKFYSISVDSTPDITHSDQLTFIVRYVLPTGPVERFLQFLPVLGHSGKNIAQLILWTNRKSTLKIVEGNPMIMQRT